MSPIEILESQLHDLQELFEDARINGRHQQMITVTKAVMQVQTAIQKQKITEGKLLERRAVTDMIDQAVMSIESVSRKYVRDDRYDAFIDELRQTLDLVLDG